MGLAAAAAIVLLCAVRGCIISRQPNEKPEGMLNISLYDRASGKTEEMPLEEYLIGVVGAEMPASFEPEALKAQAVAARTYTLYKMQTGGNHGDTADICTDSTCCQAYISEENARNNWGENADAYEEKIETAVRETDGETILYGGVPILAVFHSCSAGQTRSSGQVWVSDLPYLQAVSSPEPADSIPNYYSRVEFTAEEFREKVLASYPEADLSGDISGWLQKRRDGHRRQRGVGGRGRREHEGQHFTERPGAAVRLLRVGGGGRQAGVLRRLATATAWV